MKSLPSSSSFSFESFVNQIALMIKSESAIQQMYSSQFLYGHREILLDYAHLPRTSLILGEIQHGVLAPNEKTVYKSKRFRFGQNVPYYVWSSFVANNAKEQGFKNTLVIGSPWCYLASGARQSKTGSKVVVMPWHSTMADSSLSRVILEKKAKKFQDLIGSSNATVILYWLDFLNPLVRNVYSDFGFNTTTIGFPGIGSYSEFTNENRINFLSNVRATLNSYDILITDGFASPLFYALDLGLKVAFVEDSSISNYTNPFSYSNSTYKDNFIQSRDFLKHYLPEILGRVGEPKNREEVLCLTLGRSEELSQENLKAALKTESYVFAKLSQRILFKENEGLQIES